MKFVIGMLCMITLLSYGADQAAIDQCPYMYQPIAITKYVKNNETTFKAYLPDRHKVTVCREGPVAHQKYSGNLRYPSNNKLAKKKEKQATSEIIYLTTLQSRVFFAFYHYLFNNAEKD